MQITEFETTTLDAALFDIPPGMNAAMNVGELGKALSDANEVKLAVTDAAPPAAPVAKAPGVIRIGVPEFTNKTPLTVDTRALRARLIQDLGEAKFEAMPMAAAPGADLQKHAVDQGYDYVLLAEVSELKVAKAGGLGGLMKAASGVAGARGGAAGVAAGAAGAAGAAAGPKENTESSVAVKLMGADGKQKLATTTKGKDGSGFNLQSGLGIAKFAGTMYVGMFAGPMMMMRMNAMGISHLSGMGLMGDPNLLRYQLGGMSMMGQHRGVDTTANAAGFLVQQAVAMNKTSGFVGAPGVGPNYDESLGEALQNAAKAVQKALQK
jgi:ribosomal protein L7/L12